MLVRQEGERNEEENVEEGKGSKLETRHFKEVPGVYGRGMMKEVEAVWRSGGWASGSVPGVPRPFEPVRERRPQ